LRHRIFYSLSEVNAAIGDLLTHLNVSPAGPTITWLAAALVGVMSLTMNVVSHHTIQSGASNRVQLCESGIR
jgi:hypothetical protein